MIMTVRAAVARSMRSNGITASQSLGLEKLGISFDSIDEDPAVIVVCGSKGIPLLSIEVGRSSHEQEIATGSQG